MWRLSVIALFLACTFVPTYTTTVGLAEQPNSGGQSTDPFVSLARLELRHGFWAKLMDSRNDPCAGVDVNKLKNRLPVEGFGALAQDEMGRLCEMMKGSVMHLASEIVPEQFWAEQLGRFYARALSPEEASSFVMVYPNLAGTPAEAKLEQLRTNYLYEAFPEVLPKLRNMGVYFRIPSGAMTPSLLIGDHIIVNKLAYQDLPPGRGDVVVFKYPEDESKDFIKRIIGVPGDMIEIRNKQVMLNGIPVNDQSYTQRIDAGIIDRSINPRDNFGPITVPDSSYLVLGDNRDQSLDSRFFGVVKREKIIGKVTMIYWSWDDMTKSARWGRAGRRLILDAAQRETPMRSGQ